MASNIGLSVLCMVFFLAITEAASSLARGFNDDIDWYSMKDGKKIAKDSNKPMMVLIHKSWCGACKQLKGDWAKSEKIAQLSRNFVMINIQDDEEQGLHKGYSKMGTYIPRIVFAEPSGKIRHDITNKLGNAEYPYFYADAEEVSKAMRVAKKTIVVEEKHDAGEL